MESSRRNFLLTPSALALSGQNQPPRPAAAPLDQTLPLRFRQVHLDFHTSEKIAGVGDAFDPEEFAATLEKARVNSVTCFARCHHGMIYYDTKINPERRHPALKRNLLKEQIDACHKRNIRVPIYITVQWDYYTSRREMDWLVLDGKGNPTGTPIYEAGFYRNLCVHTGYNDFLRAHVKEVFETVPVDGIFFDIVQDRECHCPVCREAMANAKVDPLNAEQQRAFAVQRMNAWKQEMTRFVRTQDKDCSIFYNAGHIGPRHRPVQSAYTHFELESLPSGGWGYLDFPLKQRYVRTLGIDSLGMTGKFHTSWGDFHSFKNGAALEFECLLMLSLGAQCSVGDQLHPTGKIDANTYQLIGHVYRQVQVKEPWCAGARPVTEVGVLTPEEFVTAAARQIPPAAFGAVRMLQELRYQFDILDSLSDFSKYKLLILPDRIPIHAALSEKLEAYVGKGGSIIASYESNALTALGIEVVGDAPYSPDFLVPAANFSRGLPQTEHVMYMKGKQVRLRPGTEVLAESYVPYFNRTWEHFCSHRHTPSAGKAGYPGVVRNGRCIYFIHPIFEQYNANAPLWVKRLLLNALETLLPDPVLVVTGPSTLMANINEQPGQNRWILHLLHYIPERRGQAFDVIEDVIPLNDVRVFLRTPRPIVKATLVPQMQGVSVQKIRDQYYLVVPKVDGHQMVSLDFS